MDRANSSSDSKATDAIQKTPTPTLAPGSRRRQLPTKKRKLPSSTKRRSKDCAASVKSSSSCSDNDDEEDHHQQQQKCPKKKKRKKEKRGLLKNKRAKGKKATSKGEEEVASSPDSNDDAVAAATSDPVDDDSLKAGTTATTLVKEEDAATTEVIMATITAAANNTDTKPEGIQAQLNDVLMGNSSPSSALQGRATATQLPSTMISTAFSASKNTSKNMSGRGLLRPKGNQVHVGTNNHKNQNDRKRDEPTAWRVTTASPILSSVATTTPDPTKNTHKNNDGIWPKINDVLMGIERNSSSPNNNKSTTFHHIGNRRFRVLVEANLKNYFSESTTEEQILRSDDSQPHTATEMQCSVVDSIVKCVQGNIPAGRFLVPFLDTDDDCDDNANYDDLNWRLASVEEATNKVHSTFLAAGRFHLKQNQLEQQQQLADKAASFQRSPYDAPQGGALLHRAEQCLEEAGRAVQTAATEVEMDVAVDAAQAAATVVERDVTNVSAVSEPPHPQAGRLGTNTESRHCDEKAYYAPTTASKEEVPSCGYSDAIANALSKYHAKNRRAAAALEEMSSSTTASAEESAPSSSGALKYNERMMKSPATPAEVSVDNSSNSGGEVEYLVAEESSPRNNTAIALPTGLPSRGRKSIFKERMENMSPGNNGIIEHHQQQQQQGDARTLLQGGDYTFGQQTGLLQSLFPGVHPNYRPLRNNNAAAVRATSSSLEGMKGTAAAEMIMSSLAPVPSSIDQPYPVSSGVVTTTPTLRSCANSEISISPPLHLATPAVAMAGLQNQSEVKKRYQDARAPVDTVATKSLPITSMENGHPSSLQCPARIKVFLALPIDRFFVKDEYQDDCATTSFCGLPAQSTACVPPVSYTVPSNYDVLCGPGQSFFHHVGNRRFRITIEMNVQRYEEAYQAPAHRRSSTLSDGSTSGDDATGGGEYEGSIQNLINELLISLSKCDPPGRFLGMDMTNGRWRVLNPVFAQLKTEQTFFECLRVKQRRGARLQEEARRLEEECKQRRLVCDKEMMLEELEEGRMQIDTTFWSGKRRDTVETTSPATSAPGGGRRPSRRVTQGALPEETICPASSFRPLLPEEDLSVLQEQAKSLLRRRPEAVRRFSPETLEASLVAASNCRASSLLASSFPGQEHEGNSMSNTTIGSLMPPNSSCGESLSNPSTAAAVTVQPAATTTQQHYGQGVLSPPSNDNDGKCHQVHDLLDVVGGMMMMSRRGSATLVPLDNT
mmetsp:Transcript_28917/g.54697  ORF Transcript_28917/g.54697 Transcript_28917/m.54697 type:complete len:1234 (+) Transcript_28917:193-3894(+)